MGIVIVCLNMQKQNECHVDLRRDGGHLISLLNVHLRKHVETVVSVSYMYNCDVKFNYRHPHEPFHRDLVS